MKNHITPLKKNSPLMIFTSEMFAKEARSRRAIRRSNNSFSFTRYTTIPLLSNRRAGITWDQFRGSGIYDQRAHKIGARRPGPTLDGVGIRRLPRVLLSLYIIGTLFARRVRPIPRTILVWTSAGAFDGSLELRPR